MRVNLHKYTNSCLMNLDMHTHFLQHLCWCERKRMKENICADFKGCFSFKPYFLKLRILDRKLEKDMKSRQAQLHYYMYRQELSLQALRPFTLFRVQTLWINWCTAWSQPPWYQSTQVPPLAYLIWRLKETNDTDLITCLVKAFKYWFKSYPVIFNSNHMNLSVVTVWSLENWQLYIVNLITAKLESQKLSLYSTF